ncbi:MAG: SH3 domain-containing protein, partial [Bacteroidota bacterium]
VINDPDGYTNIRAGKGTSTDILDKIFDYEVFTYIEQPNEQWLEVTVTKCACENDKKNYSNPVKGYVHRSRISNLSTTNNSILKEKLTKIFNYELELYNNRASLTDRQSNDFKIASNKWVVFHEMMFDQVLNNFSNYVCSTKDEELFKLYNKIITTESGSADEAPTFAIGRIFKCQPDWALERIPKSHDYFYLLEWGCQGVTDKEHQRLLNEHRTNIGLEQVDYDNYEY